MHEAKEALERENQRLLEKVKELEQLRTESPPINEKP